MIIKQRSLIYILENLKHLNRVLVGLLFIATTLFVFHLSKKKEVEALNTSILKQNKAPPSPQFDYHLIGTGSLSLCPEMHSFPFPDLSGEVLFLAKNTRPDAPTDEVQLHIGLKGSGELLKINAGQTHYLSYEKEHLSVSKEATSLWMKPYLDENGVLWLQMGIQLYNDQGETLLDEAREFQAKQKWKPKGIEDADDSQLKVAGNALKAGKYWGPDRLFERYGGEAFQKVKGKERIELLSDQGKQILFINEGQTFIWTGGEWISSVETKGFPMGKVVAVSPYKVEWQLWDKGGMESAVLTLHKEKSSIVAWRAEEVFTKLRRRTTSRVSCRIDNSAKILKEGDWLVHTHTGWHTIKNYSEIEALLNLEVRGDLFIFDSIEWAEGKEVFCGTLFNPMRTQAFFVRLPMEQTQRGEHSPPTKSVLSTKIGAPSTDKPLTGTPSRNNCDLKL